MKDIFYNGSGNIVSIQEIIVRSGITTYRVEKLDGISLVTLNDFCSGKKSVDKYTEETLYRLAKAFGVSMCFFGDER